MGLLEIEQKFSFAVGNIKVLLRKSGFPALRTLDNLSQQAFRDTYYDSHFKLSNAGLWLRKRHRHPDASHPDLPPEGTVEWEAKQRMHGGTILRSTFSETTDRNQIRELVRTHFPDQSGDFHNQFGLDVMAQFETHRTAFLADGKFTVVLDHTDFDHRVGEVELMAEDAEKAHRDIDAFFEEYSWFFDTEKPKGKLTAYFDKFGLPKWKA